MTCRLWLQEAMASELFSTMSLCKLCASLDLANLPPSLELYNPCDSPEGLVVKVFADPDRRGASYHQDLDSLHSAAQTCPLCCLVEKGIRASIATHENHAEWNPTYQLEMFWSGETQTLEFTTQTSDPLGYRIRIVKISLTSDQTTSTSLHLLLYYQ